MNKNFSFKVRNNSFIILLFDFNLKISKELRQELKRSELNNFIISRNNIKIVSEIKIKEKDKNELLEFLYKLTNIKEINFVNSEDIYSKNNRDDLKEDKNKNIAPLFLNRTIRNGEAIEHDGDVVIVGNVNSGAKIIAGKNIVVMGNFRGIAQAGQNNQNLSKCFVSAFKLEPIQLIIKDVITRSPDDYKASEPEIAYYNPKTELIEIKKI